MKSSFITGSWAYGTPRPGSDIDIVVPMDQATLLRLRGILSKHGYTNEEANISSSNVKVGILNLICVPDEVILDAWKQGTDDLKERAPVTREEAVTHLENIRRSKNIPEWY